MLDVIIVPMMAVLALLVVLAVSTGISERDGSALRAAATMAVPLAVFAIWFFVAVNATPTVLSVHDYTVQELSKEDGSTAQVIAVDGMPINMNVERAGVIPAGWRVRRTMHSGWMCGIYFLSATPVYTLVDPKTTDGKTP